MSSNLFFPRAGVRHLSSAVLLLVDAVFGSCNIRHDTDAHEQEAVFRRAGGEAAP